MKLGRKAIIAGAAALVLAAGASAATAAVMSSGPVDSSGVIHGCWSNAKLGGSHAFVLQDAGTSCPRGTTAISWSKGTPGIDGGLVSFSSQTDTCTVLHSFGPDAVTISPAAHVIGGPGSAVWHGCTISGLPANADMQATSVFAYGDNPASVVQLVADADGSTDVILSIQGNPGNVGGEFSWIAAPSS